MTIVIFTIEEAAERLHVSTAKIRTVIRGKRGLCFWTGRSSPRFTENHMKALAKRVRVRNGYKGPPPGAYAKVIYFIRCGEFVKIGYSSNFRRRLATLQGTVPFEMEVVATICGSMTKERELHRRFADYRHRMEWFRHEGELATYIASLVPPVDSVDG